MGEARVYHCDYCGKLADGSVFYWGSGRPSFPWVRVVTDRTVSDLERPQYSEGVCCSGLCAQRWVADQVALWDVDDRWKGYAPV